MCHVCGGGGGSDGDGGGGGGGCWRSEEVELAALVVYGGSDVLPILANRFSSFVAIDWWASCISKMTHYLHLIPSLGNHGQKYSDIQK